jgi:hypothetical protein
VADRGRDAETRERVDAPDAEHDLLLDPGFQVAAVQVAGDVAVGLGVPGQVGVEQVQRHTANLRLPHLREDLTPGEVHADHERLAVGARLRLDREFVEVVVRIVLHLPPVGVQALPEVPALVQEPDPDQGQAEVRRRLEVVAGEHAQAARVDRQALSQPELGGKVGDPEVGVAAAEFGAVRLRPPAAAVHVAPEVGVHGVQLAQKPGSAASSSIRSCATRPRSRAGLCSVWSHRPGSMRRNRRIVSWSQAQRRLYASSRSRDSFAGRAGTTVYVCRVRGSGGMGDGLSSETKTSAAVYPAAAALTPPGPSRSGQAGSQQRCHTHCIRGHGFRQNR